LNPEYKIRIISHSKYKADFKSFNEVTAARFTETGVPPAARRLGILSMNQPITFGMK
jgi:hypothetical protein